jgi:hypothetical protein
MRKILVGAAVILGVLAALPVLAAEVVVPMNLITEQGIGKSIGTVTISEGPDGPSSPGSLPGCMGSMCIRTPIVQRA